MQPLVRAELNHEWHYLPLRLLPPRLRSSRPAHRVLQLLLPPLLHPSHPPAPYFGRTRRAIGLTPALAHDHNRQMQQHHHQQRAAPRLSFEASKGRSASPLPHWSKRSQQSAQRQFAVSPTTTAQAPSCTIPTSLTRRVKPARKSSGLAVAFARTLAGRERRPRRAATIRAAGFATVTVGRWRRCCRATACAGAAGTRSVWG